MKVSLAFLVTVAALGQEAPSADPITDHLRFEIAVAQRNYLDAQLRFERAQNQLLLKTAEAQKACTTQDKMWQADTFTCEKKP
jgi:hypothetical protein